MSVELQRIGWCDACTDRHKQTKVDPDESVVTLLDEAGVPHTLNLCKSDRKALIDPVLALVEKYGVLRQPSSNGAVAPARRGRPPKSAEPVSDFAPQCPKCDARIRGNRTSTINHLATYHKINRVEASKMVPAAEPRECPECGLIADRVQGLGAHVMSMHGDDVWAVVRAGMADKL